MKEQPSYEDLKKHVHFWKTMWYGSTIWGSIMTLVFIVFVAFAPVVFCGLH